MGVKLNERFYLRSNVVQIARELLGKQLVTRVGRVLTGGIIVETEAYSGSVERASHAFKNKVTPRTKVMFEKGGIAYVYLCYGIHHLFNIVTNTKGKPDAILVRAIEPTLGVRQILRRRNADKLKPILVSGPGKVSSALGIDSKLNAKSLLSNKIWIEDIGVNGIVIETGTRIGVDYAGEDAFLPWRFFIKGNPCVSRK